MIQHFNLKSISKGASAFNTEKLQWLNQHYLKSNEPQAVATALEWHLHNENIDPSLGPDLSEVVKAQAERCKTLKEMTEKSRYFYQEVDDYDEKAAKKNLKAAVLEPLQMVRDKLAALGAWEEEPMHQIIIEVAEHFELKLGKLAQPIRVAITGNTVSPPIDTTLALIGRERVLSRLDKAIGYIKNLELA